MQIASITANAANEDEILSLADGIITVTNRDYVQKTTGGTVVKSGTVPSDGKLVLTGVNSNNWDITVTGTDVPAFCYKGVTTNGTITGNVTDDLEIEIEGICNFSTSKYLVQTDYAKSITLRGEEGSTINRIAFEAKSNVLIDGVSSPLSGMGNSKISSTIGMTIKNSYIDAYGGTIGFYGSANLSLLTIRDTKLKNTVIQHVGSVLMDNVTSIGDKSIIVGSTANAEYLKILNSDLQASYINSYPLLTQVINSTVRLSQQNTYGSFAMKGNNLIKGSTIVSTSTSSGSHFTQQTSTNDFVLVDSAAILKGAVGTRTRFMGYSAIADPINESSDKLLLNKIMVPGAANSKVSLSIDGRDSVSLLTDENGYLYLYLATGKHKIDVLDFDGVDYSLEFDGVTTRESSDTSNNVGTMAPSKPQTTIVFDSYANKNIEYSFDYSTWKNGTTDGNSQILITFPNGKNRIYVKKDGNLYYGDSAGSTISLQPAKPIIKQQSEAEVTVLKGKTGTIYVNAEPLIDTEGVDYTWYKDGEQLSGKTLNTLSITNATLEDNGIYTCEVSEVNMQSSISDPITVTVTEGQTVPELQIIDQSGDKTIIKGYSTELYVLAQPITATYEWYKDGEIVEGMDSRKITVVGTVTGSAIYTCVVQTESNVMVSQPMVVTTTDNPLDSDLADLENIKNDLVNQVSDLTGQLSNAQADKANLESQIISLNDQIADLNAQVTTLQGQLLKAQEDLQAAGADKDQLNGQIQLLNSQITNLQSSIDTLNQDLHDANNQKDILQQQLSDLLNQVTTLENQITLLNQIVAEKDAENTDLRNQIISLQGQLSALQTELADLQHTVATLTEQNNALNAQVIQLQNDKQGLETLINNLQQQLIDANTTIETLTNQVNTLTTQLANVTAEKTALESNVTDLSSQVTGLNNQIILLQNKINELQELLDLSGQDNTGLLQQITDLNNQVSNLNQIISQKQELIDQLTQDKTILQGIISNLENQITTLQEKVSLLQGTVTDKENEIASLNNQIKDLQESVTALQNDLDNLQQAKEDVEKQLNDARTDINNLNSILLLIKAELGVSDDSEIIPAIRNLKELLEQQSNENVLLTNQINQLNQQLIDAQKSNDAMQQKLQELLDLLQLDNQDDIKLKIVELQTALINSQKEILQLTQDKSDLIQQLNDANTLIKDLQRQIEDLLNASGETAELLKQIKSLNDQINTLVQQNNNLQGQINDLSEKVVELNQDKITYQSEIVRLQTLLDTANSSLLEVREQLADSQAENNVLKAENENLKKEIEELKKQLASGGGTKPDVPQTQPTDNTENTELRKQLDQALSELEKAKAALAETQKQLEEEKQKVVTAVPDNAVVVLPTEKIETVPAAIKEISGSGSETPINAEFITAEKGWEIAKDLKSDWKNKIKLSELAGTATKPELTKISFYARKKTKPQQVYEYAVTAEKPIATSVTPNFTMSKLIYTGSDFKLNLSGVPTDAKVSYKSSQKSIATVSKAGQIKAIKAGKAIITGSVTGIANPYKFTINVTVSNEDKKTLNLKDEAIQTSSDNPVLVTYKLVASGEKTKLSLTGSQDATVTYVSSDSSIVTVSADGTLNGIDKGYATVTAILSQDGVIYTYVIRVRVTDGTADSNMWSYLTIA
jgi:chromosome segregation ATPase